MNTINNDSNDNNKSAIITIIIFNAFLLLFFQTRCRGIKDTVPMSSGTYNNTVDVS